MDRHLVSAAVLLTVGWAIGRIRKGQGRAVTAGQMASNSGAALAAHRRAEEIKRKAECTAQLKRELSRRQS